MQKNERAIFVRKREIKLKTKIELKFDGERSYKRMRETVNETKNCACETLREYAEFIECNGDYYLYVPLEIVASMHLTAVPVLGVMIEFRTSGNFNIVGHFRLNNKYEIV